MPQPPAHDNDDDAKDGSGERFEVGELQGTGNQEDSDKSGKAETESRGAAIVSPVVTTILVLVFDSCRGLVFRIKTEDCFILLESTAGHSAQNMAGTI